MATSCEGGDHGPAQGRGRGVGERFRETPGGKVLRISPSTGGNLLGNHTEVMRSCLLRAGLLRAAGSGQFVLGNPKAWLGNAYHAVLERVPEIETGAACEPSIDSLWNEAIELQYQRAATHPLDRRFGEPRTWPGYHLARASVLLRARFLLERRDAVHPECPGRFDETDEALSEIREKEFAAFDGKLVGRPDVIRDGEITDYKSGAIVELDEHGEHEVVKAAYIGQIRIYAYLVKKTLGWWPRRGLLLPLLGPGVEIAVDPATCETEAKAAVSLLDTYNRKIAAQSDVAILASPALGSCKWCPFKLVCPPFWTSVSPEWSGRLDGTVVEGTVTEAP